MKNFKLYFFVAVLIVSLCLPSFGSTDTLAATSIQSLQKTITALKKEISTLKATITKKDKEIKLLKTASANKDIQIKTLKVDINFKNNGIKTMENTISKQKGELASKDNEIKSREKTITDLNTSLSKKNIDIETKDKTINELKDKLTKYEDGPVTIGNSRLTPAKLGETVTVESNDDFEGFRRYSVTLTEVVSGDEAWNMIKNKNMFTDPPKPGMKYILTKFKVKITKVEKEPFNISPWDFRAVSNTGVLYEFSSIVSPDPALDTDLYNGAEYEGWTYAMVNENDTPLIVMNQKDADEIWFKIK